MNKFLEKYNLIKLTQEEMEILKTPMSIMEIECANISPK